MKAYIRPVFRRDSDSVAPIGYALTAHNTNLLTDEDILYHFPADTTGQEIKVVAAEFYNRTEVEWGNLLYV